MKDSVQLNSEGNMVLGKGFTPRSQLTETCQQVLNFILIQISTMLFMLQTMLDTVDNVGDQLSVIYTKKLCQLRCPTTPSLEIGDFWAG